LRLDIRNDPEALKAFLEISSAPAPAAHPVRGSDTAASQAAFAGDRAIFSQMACDVSHAADPQAVRMEKVIAIQQALASASGSYNIPSSVVAGKVMDAMLGGGFGSGNRIPCRERE
jgi:hypothetical protein